MTAPLELEGVTKRYGAKPAVRDLSVQIGSGERVAILGRNGAGKTTLLRLALGLSRPSRGSCRLFGQPPQDRAALRRIGYSPQLNSAPGRLRVREVIRFVCDCKDAAEPAALLDRLRLEPLLTEQAGGLSLGQLRRLTVLLAFIGEPDLVVLDEPTVSLDAESRSAVWELIDEFCDAGGTLLLASHDFREVAALTQRVLVLANGQLRADNQVSELARSAGVTALEVPRRTDLSLAEASFVTHTADRTVLVTRQPELVLQRIGGLADQGRVVQRRPTVEEVCLALAGGTR